MNAAGVDQGPSATTNDGHQRRLSTSGDALYGILGLEKTATQDEIKQQFQTLALKYHPDNNPNNPAAAEMFIEINKAYAILSDERKKQIYDTYGSLGLQAADTIGEENMAAYLLSQNKCFRCLLLGCFFSTFGCFCCGCFCCCCCFCCGLMKPPEDEQLANNAEQRRDEAFQENTTNSAGVPDGPRVITSQPTGHGGYFPVSQRPTVIPMSSPPPYSQDRDTPPPAYSEISWIVENRIP